MSHISHSDDASETMYRRRFLGMTFGMAAVAASPALALAATRPSPAKPAVRMEWDLGWIDRIRGDHRMVFDAQEVAHGMSIGQVVNWIYGYREAYGLADRDVAPVLVLRHGAVVMALGDAIWQRLGVGERLKINDRATGAPTLRNPFLSAKTVAPAAGADEHGHRADTIDTLIERGVIVLACGMALRGQTYQLQQKEQLTAEAAQQEIRAHLATGVYVVPSGVFAVGRAQEAGCNYVRAS